MRVQLFLFFGIIVFTALPMETTKGEGQSFIFLIPDGEMLYQEINYYRSEAASDPNGIEWVMNISTSEEIQVTSLSSSIVKFEKKYAITVIDSYQKRNLVKHSPTHYGLKFYDEDDNELGADNASTLTFSLTRNVNKHTGERVLAQNPYGADYVTLMAFYDESQVYSYTEDLVSFFGGVGSLTNIFDVNATSWEIGDIIEENYTISGSGMYQNYDTWIRERNNISEGYAEYISTNENEKTSGLYVKGYYKGVKTDDYYSESYRSIQSLEGVIDDGYPQVTAPIGRIANRKDPILITFNGNDTNYDHYNLYRNNSQYETNTAMRTEWSFTVTPTTGNTTWTFEIVDTLGYSGNATTWLMYKALETTTSTVTTTTSTPDTVTSTINPTTTPDITPSWNGLLILLSLVVIIWVRRLKKNG